MKINISEELKSLAEIFERNGETLYVVGGYVRDSLLNLKINKFNDIDLCSSCKPEKVAKILNGTSFATDESLAKYGTVIITGKKRYEYTTFRKENYNNNGEHNPVTIEFVKKVETDSQRRDFSINAIYYNITEDEILDPEHGVSDLKKKLLVCIGKASERFKEDSERILRMIRLACSLNLEIEQKTLLAAYESAAGVSKISKQRLRAELDRMIVCDKYYPNYDSSKYAHAKCMLLIGELNLWPYIMPALEEIKKSSIKDEKGENLYSHVINTFSVCAPNSRLACLLHDVGKLYTKTKKNNFNFSVDWANIIIEKNLGIEGLCYSKKTIEQTKRIVSNLDFDKHGIELKINVKKFIRENLDIFDQICDLKDAIALENTDFTRKSKIAARWKNIYKNMKAQNTPLNLSELDINGSDIIDIVPEIKLDQIGNILNYLLDYCLRHPSANNKNFLLELAKKKILKNPSKYFE